ncbi:PepSY-associated TM helix domain-containing protein [Chitinophaga sp. NPDC101104]|uniref:PepSY-associated TM helix domain-containing protein n=1 Tax=Chitinophaga sp. NPDC101104 TaxID=3390561 RepID=UPI003D0207BC
MKIFFRNIHLYLSLAAGLVIMVTCFTGAVLVFEEELNHTFSKERYYVEPQGERLPLAQLVNNLNEKVPGAKVSAFRIYNDPARSVELTFSPAEKKGEKKEGAGEKKKDAKPAAGRPGGGGGKKAFMNPYTGEVIEIYVYQDTFFYTMFALHRWMLGGAVGKMIVGICTLVFLFIILTGIILWWPKTRNILRQRLKVKWDAGWKRLNHDLHIVLGFYAAIFLFIFAFTGLAWSFEWFNDGIYKVTNSSPKGTPPPASHYVAEAKPVAFDVVYQKAKATVPDAHFYNIAKPKDSAAAYSVSMITPRSAHESASDNLFIDQYSGEVLQLQAFGDRNLGQRVRSTFKPVHIASIWGTPSKIIGLIVCLLGVTFPITGIIMWINRLRKQKKTGKSKARSPRESNLVG